MGKFALKVSALIMAALIFSACSAKEAPEEAGGIKEKTSGESVATEVNSPAPAFAAKLMGGGETRLSDYLGKVVLLEFWSVFCKSCLEEMPAVKELHKRYKDQGLEVISINTDAFSDARVMQVLEKAGMTVDYPVVRDMRKEISAAFDVELLPVTVVIDRNGWIRLYQEGYRRGEEESFEKVIKKCLSGEGGEDVTLAPRGGVTAFAPAGARQPAKEGQAAGKLDVTAQGGKKIALGRGKPSVLFFWSLYCQPCRAEMPEIARLKEEYAGRAQFLSVNVDPQKLSARVEKFASTQPGLDLVNDYASLAGETLSDKFGISATPTLIILDEAGRVAHSLRGAVKAGDIATRLAAMGKAGNGAAR